MLDVQQYELVKCNMGIELSDPSFQQTTGVRVNKHLPLPIAFDFKRTSSYDTSGSVVPYQSAVLNQGDAMSLNGVFTVPVDGIYEFTFNANKYGSDVPTMMYLRLDGNVVARIYGYSVDDSMSETVILQLSAGQKVDAYLLSGSASIVGDGYRDIHFVGRLLFVS